MEHGIQFSVEQFMYMLGYTLIMANEASDWDLCMLNMEKNTGGYYWEG